jgi:hypothetical protein
MADNAQFQGSTPSYPPVGMKVSGDEATDGSGLLQRIKFCYSADGDSTHVGADVNGLDVDVTRVGGTVAVTQSGTSAR